MNINEIEEGDFIGFGAFGSVYVTDPNYTKTTFWVTDIEEDRFDKYTSGWSMGKRLARYLLDDNGDIIEDIEQSEEQKSEKYLSSDKDLFGDDDSKQIDYFNDDDW